MKLKHPVLTDHQAAQFALREFAASRSLMQEGATEQAVIKAAAMARLVMLRVMLRQL